MYILSKLLYSAYWKPLDVALVLGYEFHSKPLGQFLRAKVPTGIEQNYILVVGQSLFQQTVAKVCFAGVAPSCYLVYLLHLDALWPEVDIAEGTRKKLVKSEPVLDARFGLGKGLNQVCECSHLILEDF